MTGRKIIIFLVIILFLVIGFVVFKQEASEKKQSGISLEEKKQIDVWIEENNLNQYGDPKDTVYTGGTPLFDERTGQTIDKYEYILRKYPDKPWLK